MVHPGDAVGAVPQLCLGHLSYEVGVNRSPTIARHRRRGTSGHHRRPWCIGWTKYYVPTRLVAAVTMADHRRSPMVTDVASAQKLTWDKTLKQVWPTVVTSARRARPSVASDGRDGGVRWSTVVVATRTLDKKTFFRPSILGSMCTKSLVMTWHGDDRGGGWCNGPSGCAPQTPSTGCEYPVS